MNHGQVEMEVRWRLFARDILSMTIDGNMRFIFGRPLRPVKGLRFFGMVVRKSRPNFAQRILSGHETLQGQVQPTGGCFVDTMDGDFGLLTVGGCLMLCYSLSMSISIFAPVLQLIA